MTQDGDGCCGRLRKAAGFEHQIPAKMAPARRRAGAGGKQSCGWGECRGAGQGTARLCSPGRTDGHPSRACKPGRAPVPLQQPHQLAPVLHGMVAQGPQGAECWMLSSAVGSHCTEGCSPAPWHSWVLRAFPGRAGPSAPTLRPAVPGCAGSAGQPGAHRAGSGLLLRLWVRLCFPHG